MTRPTPDRDDPDTGRSDEDREISDVGLPHGDDAGPPTPGVDEAGLDEVFPPEEGSA